MGRFGRPRFAIEPQGLGEFLPDRFRTLVRGPIGERGQRGFISCDLDAALCQPHERGLERDGDRLSRSPELVRPDQTRAGLCETSGSRLPTTEPAEHHGQDEHLYNIQRGDEYDLD